MSLHRCNRQGVIGVQGVHVTYDTPFPRRDLLGIHPQKQSGMFWVGACVPAGRMTADDFHSWADVAEK